VSDARTITWSLVSHTNAGKTTLARTLLGEEIGEVADQAHVTDRSESRTLLEAGGHRLVLFDTPGFGDSARLLARLRAQEKPLGWLLAQVWDRIADRPLWCSQQAVANVRDEADLVLYLVNAAESPEEAGYVPLELEILEWVGAPVILVLNQVGEGRAEEIARLEERWRAETARNRCVRAVTTLDAHRRSWIEEGVLLEESARWLPAQKQVALAALTEEWRGRARRRIEDTVRALAEFLAELLHHREPLVGSAFSPGAKRAARERIRDRVETRSRELLGRWIAGHGLSGELAERIEADWRHYVDSGEVWLDAKRLGLGGALGGAATGAIIDAKTLGASFGTGALVGGILGGIAGYGLGGWIAERSTRGRSLRIGPEAIEALLARLLVGLLAITHHGRGRGEVRPEELARRWGERAGAALAVARRELAPLWVRGRESGREPEKRSAELLAEPLREVVTELLAADSPRIRETLSRLGAVGRPAPRR